MIIIDAVGADGDVVGEEGVVAGEGVVGEVMEGVVDGGRNIVSIWGVMLGGIYFVCALWLTLYVVTFLTRVLLIYLAPHIPIMSRSHEMAVRRLIREARENGYEVNVVWMSSEEEELSDDDDALYRETLLRSLDDYDGGGGGSFRTRLRRGYMGRRCEDGVRCTVHRGFCDTEGVGEDGKIGKDDEDFDKRCPICFDKLSGRRLKTVRTCCGHIYHGRCFTNVLAHEGSGYKCPVCRHARPVYKRVFFET